MTNPLPCPFCGFRAQHFSRLGHTRCLNKGACGAVVEGDQAKWDRRDKPAAVPTEGELRAAVVLGPNDPHGDRAWQAQQRRRARPR